MLCCFFVQYFGCWHDISWCRKVAKRQWKCNSFCLKVLHPDVAGKSTEVVQLLLLFPKKCAGICIPAMPFLVDIQKINEGTQEVKWKKWIGFSGFSREPFDWVHWNVVPLRCSFRRRDSVSWRRSGSFSLTAWNGSLLRFTLKDYEHGMEALKKALPNWKFRKNDTLQVNIAHKFSFKMKWNHNLGHNREHKHIILTARLLGCQVSGVAVDFVDFWIGD